MVSHRCRCYHGRQSSCSLDKWPKTGVLLMDIKPAFPIVATARLFNLMNVRQIDRDLIKWMESFLSERPVEMIIEGNAMERHPVEAGVPPGPTGVTDLLCNLNLRIGQIG